MTKEIKSRRVFQELLAKTIAVFCRKGAQEAQFSKSISSLKMNLILVHFAPLRGYTLFEFALEWI
jgi:hypothetical protein